MKGSTAGGWAPNWTVRLRFRLMATYWWNLHNVWGDDSVGIQRFCTQSSAKRNSPCALRADSKDLFGLSLILTHALSSSIENQLVALISWKRVSSILLQAGPTRCCINLLPLIHHTGLHPPQRPCPLWDWFLFPSRQLKLGTSHRGSGDTKAAAGYAVICCPFGVCYIITLFS